MRYEGHGWDPKKPASTHRARAALDLDGAGRGIDQGGARGGLLVAGPQSWRLDGPLPPFAIPRQAWARSATAEAVALLHRGLALVPALPDGDGRAGTELDLRVALGQAVIMNRGWGAPELRELHSRARELASALNRPRALLFAVWGQFTDHWARADLKQARRLAAELRDLGDRAGDILMQVMGCDAGGLTAFHLGEFTVGRAYLKKGLALYDPTHRPCYSELLSHDAGVFVRLHLSWVLACLGNLDQALSQSDAALDEARRLSHPPTLAAALGTACLIGWFVGSEPAALLPYADKMLSLATKHGLRLYWALALIWRGWCLAALGHADEGIPLLAAGAAGINELGYIAFRPRELTLFGDAYRIAGQWEAALAHLAEARRLAEETEARWLQAATLRLSGDVLAAMSDRTGAEVSYRDAIAIAQRQSAKLWELRAVTSLAWLWREQRKRAQAHALLAPVYGWFAEGFGTPVLQRARALLEDVDR